MACLNLCVRVMSIDWMHQILLDWDRRTLRFTVVQWLTIAPCMKLQQWSIALMRVDPWVHYLWNTMLGHHWARMNISWFVINCLECHLNFFIRILLFHSLCRVMSRWATCSGRPTGWISAIDRKITSKLSSLRHEFRYLQSLHLLFRTFDLLAYLRIDFCCFDVELRYQSFDDLEKRT